MKFFNKILLTVATLLSFNAVADDLSINSRTCELTLLDTMRSGSLYPLIEEALAQKGYRLKHVLNEQFKNENAQPGDLWAIGSAHCDMEIDDNPVIPNKRYCEAEMLIDLQTENGSFETIFRPYGVDQGYFSVDIRNAVQDLIPTIPTCNLIP